MGESVVADAGPLIAFGRIQRLELLPQVLGEVLVPHAVAVECLADREKPGARAICDAFQAQLLTETADPVPCDAQIPDHVTAGTSEYSWCSPPNTDFASTRKPSAIRCRDCGAENTAVLAGGSGTPGPNAMCGRDSL